MIYRPISILPVISKVAEKWIANLIIKHLDKGHTPLHCMQSGFRARHSTESANSFFIVRVKGLLDRNPCVAAVFLDLRKAFDTVSHQILLSKLSRFNFSPAALQWFKSYLHGRKQCVSVAGVKSTYRNCPVGIPQGSTLGPLSFSLYINDLPDVCTVHSQMYADDVVIVSHGKTPKEAAQIMTTVLTRIQGWLIDSCLHVNTKKTVCMFLSKKPVEAVSSNVFLGNEELELV